MNLYTALKTGQLSDAPLGVQQLHVRTRDGKLGTVKSLRYSEARNVFLVTLRHFDGSEFDHEYAAAWCDLLERRPR